MIQRYTTLPCLVIVISLFSIFAEDLQKFLLPVNSASDLHIVVAETRTRLKLSKVPVEFTDFELGRFILFWA
jgi:hypothetical protein